MAMRVRSGVLFWGLVGLLLYACDSTGDEGIKVVRYQGPPITEESVQDHTWTATVDSVWDQVTLEARGEDGALRHRIYFQRVPEGLPVYLGYLLYSGRGDSTALRSGTFYIQRFDLNGEMSGRFEGTLASPGLGLETGGVFWVDRSAPGSLR